jgi:ketosteroid isomerase-like protein
MILQIYSDIYQVYSDPPGVGPTTETEQFLATMSPRITEAETALHNGDPGPRAAMWSRAEPLTLFGAAMSARGWGQIGPIFGTLGKQFSDCLSYQNEIVAAEARGDLAYTVALEHTTTSVNGAEPAPYVLRATTIFRREDGEWKAVHRHGDALAADSAAVVGRLTPPAAAPKS